MMMMTFAQTVLSAAYPVRDNQCLCKTGSIFRHILPLENIKMNITLVLLSAAFDSRASDETE